MTKNQEKFKRTFKAIHAPDDLTQEVLSMANSLENTSVQNSKKSNRMRSYTTTAEVKTSSFNFRGLAVGLCCVAVIGVSTIAFGSFKGGSGMVSSKSEHNNVVTTATSATETTLEAQTTVEHILFDKFTAVGDISLSCNYLNEENSEWRECQRSVLTDDDISEFNSIADCLNWSEITAEEFNEHSSTNDSSSLQFYDTDGNLVNIYMLDGVMEVSTSDPNVENSQVQTHYQCDDMDTFENLSSAIISVCDNDSTDTSHHHQEVETDSTHHENEDESESEHHDEVENEHHDTETENISYHDDDKSSSHDSDSSHENTSSHDSNESEHH